MERREWLTEHQRKAAELYDLAGILRQPPDEVESQFSEWLKHTPFSYKDTMDMCRYRALAGRPMPWVPNEAHPGEVFINLRVAIAANDMLALCRDLHAELGTGSDLDWHLRQEDYAVRLRAILAQVGGRTDAP